MDGSRPSLREGRRSGGDGDLYLRAARALRGLQICLLCPRQCGLDRTAGEVGICRAGATAEVSSWGARTPRERVLGGERGSGMVVFAGCPLRCTHCQSWRVSQGSGEPYDVPRLAALFGSLEKSGCRNLNLVSPTHYVPQVLAALALADDQGLRLPVVYTSSGYESVEALRFLDGIVDVYVADLKFMDADVAESLTKARDYPAAAREALVEMHRQVGDLDLDGEGIARRGLIVRLPILPLGLGGTREAVRFVAQNLSKQTYLTLMDGYRPGATHNVRDPRLLRELRPEEVHDAFACALEEGLTRIDDRTARGPMA